MKNNLFFMALLCIFSCNASERYKEENKDEFNLQLTAAAAQRMNQDNHSISREPQIEQICCCPEQKIYSVCCVPDCCYDRESTCEDIFPCTRKMFRSQCSFNYQLLTCKNTAAENDKCVRCCTFPCGLCLATLTSVQFPAWSILCALGDLVTLPCRSTCNN